MPAVTPPPRTFNLFTRWLRYHPKWKLNLANAKQHARLDQDTILDSHTLPQGTPNDQHEQRVFLESRALLEEHHDLKIQTQTLREEITRIKKVLQHLGLRRVTLIEERENTIRLTRAQKEKLDQEIQTLANTIAEQQARITQLKQQQITVNAEHTQLIQKHQQQLEAFQHTVTELEQEVANTQTCIADLSTLEQMLLEKRQTHTTTAHNLAQAEAALCALQTELETTENSISDRQQQLQTKQEQLAELNASVDSIGQQQEALQDLKKNRTQALQDIQQELLAVENELQEKQTCFLIQSEELNKLDSSINSQHTTTKQTFANHQATWAEQLTALPTQTSTQQLNLDKPENPTAPTDEVIASPLSGIAVEPSVPQQEFCNTLATKRALWLGLLLASLLLGWLYTWFSQTPISMFEQARTLPIEIPAPISSSPLADTLNDDAPGNYGLSLRLTTEFSQSQQLRTQLENQEHEIATHKTLPATIPGHSKIDPERSR